MLSVTSHWGGMRIALGVLSLDTLRRCSLAHWPAGACCFERHDVWIRYGLGSRNEDVYVINKCEKDA